MKLIFQSIGKHVPPTAISFFLAAGIFLSGASMAAAQEQTSVITGKVTGPHGVPIGGAAVEAIDVDHNTTVSVKSDENGIYHVTGLPIGRYEVISSMRGYHTWKHRSFTLSYHQIARINVSMGTICEVCGSDFEAPLLQTDSTEVRDTIDGSILAKLPRP